MTTYTDPYAEPRRFDPVQAGLTVTLFVLLGVCAYLGFGQQRGAAELREARQTISTLEAELEREKARAEQELRTAESTHQAELQRSRSEWASQMEAQREETERRLQTGMAEVSRVVDEVVNNSGATLGYLRQMEAKVREGQALQAAEVDKLRAVAGGLSYLSQQYEKPIEEFKELSGYLSRQLELPANATPEEKGRLLRRLFSREFRDEQRNQLAEFHQDQGRRDALVAMQTKVEQSYGKAQAEMAGLRADQQNFVAGLESIITGKADAADSMDSFFQVSSRIIDVHQRMLNLEAPDAVSPPLPPVPVAP